MRFSIQPAMRINKRTRSDAALATLISKYPELIIYCGDVLHIRFVLFPTQR